MQQLKYGLLVLMVTVVAGCAGTGGYSHVPVEEAGSTSEGPTQNPAPGYEPQPSYTNSVPSSRPGENRAVIALLDTADKQSQNGDYMGAAATLERAIRISPRDPELYYQLAQVRYWQGNYPQTEQFCRKAMTLAAGNDKLLERCRRLLEQVH